jgi:hypothetical protein
MGVYAVIEAFAHCLANLSANDLDLWNSMEVVCSSLRGVREERRFDEKPI